MCRATCHDILEFLGESLAAIGIFGSRLIVPALTARQLSTASDGGTTRTVHTTFLGAAAALLDVSLAWLVYQLALVVCWQVSQ
jgi:hypothetical protein